MCSIKSKKLLVFDLDGTLLDSFPLLMQAMQEVLHAQGLQTPAATELRAQLSGGLSAMFDSARALHPELAEHEWRVLRLRYLQRYEDLYLTATPLFAGVQEVLQTLHRAGLQLAVCTNRDRRTSERLLTQWGIRPWLCALVTLDDMPKPKPSPDGLLSIVRAQGLSPHEVLFVGDSGIDCQTALAAGVEFHAHLPGYHSSEQELLPHTHAFTGYRAWLAHLQLQGCAPLTAPSRSTTAD